MNKVRLLAAAAFAATLSTSAYADISYTQTVQGVNGIMFTNSTGVLMERDTQGPNMVSEGGLQVNLTLNDGTTVQALFNFDGKITTPAVANGNGGYSEFPVNGSFSFRGLGANAGTTYLAATFTNGELDVNGKSGSIFDTNSAKFTNISGTQLMNPLPHRTGYSFSISLTAINPRPVTIGANGMLTSFGARSSGTFATQAVPELSVWAMMLVGFAGIGTVIRRRGLTLPGRQGSMDGLLAA